MSSCNQCDRQSCGCNSCDACNNCNACNTCNNCNSCNNCGCDWSNWANWNNWDFGSCGWPRWPWLWNCGCHWDDDSNCPFSRWRHHIQCNPAFFSFAGCENGPTLVIHKIVLEAGGEQSCTPRNFHIRITGPSYPCGEIFTLRAGSCLELDEPLVISGLEPGQYEIEELHDCPRDFISTITGPVCGRCVTVANSCAPTVITIVNRRRVCRGLRRRGCGCSSCC